MRKFLYLLGILFLPSVVSAQGFHVQDVVLINQGGYAKPAPGLITVCTSTATINPSTKLCSPTVTIYSDITLMSTKANGFKADANGNFDFYVPPGTYLYTITGVNAASQSHTITAPCTFDSTVTSCVPGGSSAAPGTPSTSVQFNGTGNFAGDSNFTWDNTNKVLNVKTAMFSGYPQTDIQCTGNAATDSAAIAAAITTARANLAGIVGHVIRINGGSGAFCYWDGTLYPTAFDGAGGFTSASPLIIELNGAIKTYNRGFVIGVNDVTSGVYFVGVRGGGAAHFGNATFAQIDSGDNGDYSLMDVPGIIGGFSSVGVTYNGHSATAPVVRIHTFDKISTNCGSPPCGATQITIHGAINNAGAATTLSLDDAGAVIRGAWSGVTTYAYDDEVTTGGVRYISMQGSNLNHAPAGGSPWWFPAGIAGFDADLNGLSLNPVSGLPLTILNYGNVHTNGPMQSWYSGGNPSIQITCDNNVTCDEYNISLIKTEAGGGAVVGAIGPVGHVTIDQVVVSDPTGTPYLFKHTGSGSASLKITNSNPFSAANAAYIDPASNQVVINPGSDFDASMIGTAAIPASTIQPAGFFQSKVLGQVPNVIRNGIPVNVRYANLAQYYLPVPGAYVGYTIAAATDPYGSSNASEVTTSIANDGPLLYNVNSTPAVGDTFIAGVWVRVTGANMNGLNNSADFSGSGSTITTKGWTFPNPFPSGAVTNNGWQWVQEILTVTATDGAMHTLLWQLASSDTTTVYQFSNPMLIKIPVGDGLPLQEEQEYGFNLSPYPTTCSVGQVCGPFSLFSPLISYVQLQAFDFGTDVATGDGAYYFTVPEGFDGKTLVSVSGSVTKVGMTNTTDVQLAKCSVVATGDQCSGTVVDMLSTKLTIDSNENKSSTATAPVINGANATIATDQQIRVDVDAVSTTPPKGLTITLGIQ